MNRFLIVIGCSLVAQSAAWAQTEPSDASLKSDVLRLVRQLDDDRRTQRDAAEQALIGLGPEAMQFYPEITRRTPAEVKERLGRVRKSLELVIAEVAAAPARVTLGGSMTLAEAFAALEEQTGNRIVGYDDQRGKVTLDWKDTPYWQALDELLDEAGLKINAYGGQSDAHVVIARPDDELSPLEGAVYSGVFRFEATLLESRRDLRNSLINGMQLTVAVGWEPRVRPISLQQPLDNIQAVDDQGQMLTINQRQNRGMLNAVAGSGIATVDLRIPIELAPRGAKRIASFKGVLNALVPGSVETFEFTELGNSRDVEKRKAGVAVTFERIRKNGDAYELRMRVRFENAASALQSHYGWVLNNEAYMLDADGERIEHATLQETRRSEGEVGVGYLYVLPAGPEGCKFIYKTPASILQLPVEYELKDLDLP